MPESMVNGNHRDMDKNLYRDLCDHVRVLCGDQSERYAKMGAITIVYVVLTLCKNGANMCVSTANTAFMSDLIDYELDRSGRYVPAVVTGTYSFLDKLISSFGQRSPPEQ